MQSLRLLAGMIVLETALLITRALDPYLIDGIAIYCLWAFAAIGLATCIVGLLATR